MTKAKVYLVGAGPGDPELLTLKAVRALRSADLVIYDYLANPEHLTHARRGARTLGVGKGFRHKKISQQKINRLILDNVRKGHNVVRLKGGDPYLFGRGGEEAEFLAEHRIPFEVVPGVTSATACAAYAGIPLTHRDHNASVTFLTGHRAADRHLDSVGWEQIVALRGTIVIYMGLYNLGVIAERLVRAGMRRDTPVSVIEWGTLPRQRSVDGTLATIRARVAARRIQAPAMIIIGEVVRLRKKLDWFEKLPLFGRTVLITRLREQAGELSERFRRSGARVIECPTIEVRPAKTGPLDRAVRNASRYDWLVFTSVNGVDGFFARVRALGRDARALGLARVAAVGPGTACRLKKYGVRADLVPKRFETASLVPELRRCFGPLSQKKFLLLRTDIAPMMLERDLENAGARVERVTAYRTIELRRLPGPVRRDLARGGVDWITFTSASTVNGLARMAGAKLFSTAVRRCKIASIGPVTSRALRAHGARPTCQARPFTLEGLVAAVEKDR